MNDIQDGNNTLTYVLPDVIDPQEFVCVTLRIPKNKFHIMAFKGAVWDLCNWWNWERNDAHDATKVAQVWRRVFRSMVFSDCTQKQTDLIEAEIEMAIHVDCDCNVTVDCCDGTTKQLATTDMLNQPGQPGGGSPQPQPGGGCQTYSLTLTPMTMALAPTTVNSGDTVQVLNVAGSWNDGSGFAGWYCPDGKKFFGSCVPGSATTDGSDPLPAAFYMQIIGVLNGTTYFDPFSVYTIPGGVTSGTVEFQANRPALTSAWGNITFDAKVCNNSTPPATPWCRDFNFMAVSYAGLVTDPFPDWVAGLGWDHPHVNGDQSLQIAIGASLSINYLKFVVNNLSDGTADSGFVHDDNTLTNPGFSLTTVGAITTIIYSGTAINLVKAIRLNFRGDPDGYLQEIQIKGATVAPTVGATC